MRINCSLDFNEFRRQANENTTRHLFELLDVQENNEYWEYRNYMNRYYSSSPSLRKSVLDKLGNDLNQKFISALDALNQDIANIPNEVGNIDPQQFKREMWDYLSLKGEICCDALVDDYGISYNFAAEEIFADVDEDSPSEIQLVYSNCDDVCSVIAKILIGTPYIKVDKQSVNFNLVIDDIFPSFYGDYMNCEDEMNRCVDYLIMAFEDYVSQVIETYINEHPERI